MNLAVFDIDGTLIVENSVEDRCYLDALVTVFGFEGVNSDWSSYSDVTDSGLLTELCVDRLGRGPTEIESDRFRDTYCSQMIDRLLPGDGHSIPGADAILSLLRENADWAVSIATGNYRRLATHKLVHAGISCLDLPMATADDHKNRGALIEHAVTLARAGYGVSEFEHVVSIGDAPWDLRTAREIRMPFVAVGQKCGRVAEGRYIVDYDDVHGVMSSLSNAVCW